jgi:hypothetical protein
LDIDWGSVTAGTYLIIDCYRSLDPSDYSKVWNDSADVGFRMVSEKTGEKLIFTFDKLDKSADEVHGCWFKAFSKTHLKELKVLIIND